MNKIYALRKGQGAWSSGTQVYVVEDYHPEDLVLCRTRFPPYKDIETPASNLVQRRNRIQQPKVIH